MSDANKPHIPNPTDNSTVSGNVGDTKIGQHPAIVTKPDASKAALAENKRLEAENLMKQCQKILEENGMKETNVPLGSEYWTMLNRYRALVNNS